MTTLTPPFSYQDEDKFHKLFERSPVGMALIEGSSGEFLEVNPSLLRATGYTKQEFLNLSFWDITPKGYEEQEASQVASLKEKGFFGPNEKEYLRKDGSRFPIRISGFSFTDTGGREVIWGLIEDISQQKSAEETTQRSEQKLQDVIDAAQLGYWDWDYKTGKQFVNDRWLLMLGLSRDEIDNEVSDWESRVHPDDIQRTVTLVEAHIQSGEPYVAEFRMKHADGRWVWIQASGAVVERDKITQEPTRLCGTHQDITGRKKAEQALVESESRFRDLLQNISSVSIQGYRLDGTATYWNKASENLYGYTAEQAVGRNLLDLIIPEEMKSQVAERVQWMEETGQAIPASELLLVRQDGSRVAVFSSHAIVHSESQPSELFCIDIDLTAQKEAEEKLLLTSRVFSDTHEGVLITDANRLIIDVNPAFCSITGYSREEVIGKNPSLLHSSKQSPEFYQQMWQEINEQGHWQGEVWNRKKNGEIYAEFLSISALTNNDNVVTNYIGTFTDITGSKRQQEALNLMAYYDVLTQLPNRALFLDRFHKAVAHSKRTGHQLAVCFLDLDDFKPINDKYGHEVGDQLLIEVAKRISFNVRDEDTVSRQGGDEFALLLNDIESYAQCEQILGRIHHALAEPFVISGQPLKISASSGITLYPSDEGDIDTLLRHADQAMYQAKLAGKHRYHLFDPLHDEGIAQKHHQLDEIKQALANDEFQLYYQPKVNMAKGDVFGVEALIRWISPVKGLIAPLDFLPAIDGTPLELQVGEWVVQEALQQLNHWQQQGIKLQVSVNISSNHLLSNLFVANLKKALAKYPALQPKNLELEILESSALGDLKAVGEVLKICQDQMGIRSALDDFGTGYSSLAHLRNLPVKSLKIDQSFVRDMLDDPNDYAIIDGTIGLADAFGREVIAEGVETTNHGLMLIVMDCELAQGYGIARPMPADELSQWLNGYSPNQQWLNCASLCRTDKEKRVKLFQLVTEQWKDKLIAKIISPLEEAEALPIMDVNDCSCGTWLKRAKADRLFEVEKLRQLDQLHTRLHLIAGELLQQYQDEDISATPEGLADLQSAFDEMSEAIGALV